MRPLSNQRARAAVLVVLLALTPAALRAQMGITLWAGAGGTSPDNTITFGTDAKQLGVQVGLPVVPVAVRADGLMFGSTIKTDAMSYSLNAVMQMRLPVVQPYLIVGQGRYAMGGAKRESGWNYGLGVRAGLGRFGLFAEVRKHEKLGQTLSVLGVTF